MKENTPAGYARKAICEKTIPYRPAYTKITKKVTASILLQQIVHYWEYKERKPFYKFRAPCSHDLYREGDSWIEDLGFTAAEFDSAIKTIGTKITKGKSRAEALKGTGAKNLVIYWTDANRVTWYELNQTLFDLMTDPLYQDNEPAQIPNSENCNYIEIQEQKNTRKLEEPELHITENTSKNIPKNTSMPTKTPDPPKEPVKEKIPGCVEQWDGPPPPAAEVYRSRTRRWPRKTQYRRIHETVGDKDEDLEFWGNVVAEYDALGWNPVNIVGMIEWFERRELPHIERKRHKSQLPDALEVSRERRRQQTIEGEYVAL